MITSTKKQKILTYNKKYDIIIIDKKWKEKINEFKILWNRLYITSTFFKGEIQLDKDLDVIEFNEYYTNNCLYFKKPFKEFEIDNTYFIIKNDEEPFGIISLHKGFTFIDCAEHDERVIIKRAFPDIKCNIVGEKE